MAMIEGTNVDNGLGDPTDEFAPYEMDACLKDGAGKIIVETHVGGGDELQGFATAMEALEALYRNWLQTNPSADDDTWRGPPRIVEIVVTDS
jgi:hypothetical protein